MINLLTKGPWPLGRTLDCLMLNSKIMTESLRRQDGCQDSPSALI